MSVHKQAAQRRAAVVAAHLAGMDTPTIAQTQGVSIDIVRRALREYRLQQGVPADGRNRHGHRATDAAIMAMTNGVPMPDPLTCSNRSTWRRKRFARLHGGESQ